MSNESTEPGTPDRRVIAKGLPEFRALVAEQMAAYGWPMYEDDEGATYIKVDGLFDAVITASLAVIGDRMRGEADDEGGDAV